MRDMRHVRCGQDDLPMVDAGVREQRKSQLSDDAVEGNVYESEKATWSQITAASMHLISAMYFNGNKAL